MAPRLELEPLADRHVERLAELWFKDRDDLRRVNPSRHEGPLTLELAREGIGTAALGLACTIGFDELGLHRLEAGAHPTNVASQTAIRRNGFTEIGLAQAYLFLDGAWQDQLLFQKLAP